MLMLDWEALIQAAPPCETTQAGACNHKDGVTGASVVTTQAHVLKEQNRICNHGTTETTKTEEIRPSHTSEEENHLPGGEWCGTDRAGSDTGAGTLRRPVLHYRLHGVRNGAGSVIGEPGEALACLLHVLMQHYGDRLDAESVREAFEERAAIIEFDALLPRTEAEHSAASSLAGVNGSFLKELEQG